MYTGMPKQGISNFLLSDYGKKLFLLYCNISESLKLHKHLSGYTERKDNIIESALGYNNSLICPFLLKGMNFILVYVKMDVYVFFNQFPTDEHLNCFQFFAVINIWLFVIILNNAAK